MGLKGVFGTCPRVLCERQHVLPIGNLEDPSQGLPQKMKVFCPFCEQVYAPMRKYRKVADGKCDIRGGEFFDASFPQMFLQTYPSLVPPEQVRSFIPRVHGFRLHKQKSLIARKLEDEQISRKLEDDQRTSGYPTHVP